MPPENENRINDDDLEQEIARVAQSLIEIEERYAQVKRDRQRKRELKEYQAQLEAQSHDPQDIKLQLQQIQQALDTIEFNLESRLFRWRQLREPFWEAVRFGGLGIVIGWLLKSWVGN